MRDALPPHVRQSRGVKKPACTTSQRSRSHALAATLPTASLNPWLEHGIRTPPPNAQARQNDQAWDASASRNSSPSLCTCPFDDCAPDISVRDVAVMSSMDIPRGVTISAISRGTEVALGKGSSATLGVVATGVASLLLSYCYRGLGSGPYMPSTHPN